MNRYNVMPLESTRMFPSVGLLATMTVSLLPEEDGPVFGIAGACVLATGAEVGATGVACGAQEASNTANISIVL